MRFGYLETMTKPAFMKPLAIAAEEAGFDAFIVPDSICYPEHADSKYPYNDDGSREFLEDKPFIEALTLIPFLLGVTSRIGFTTSVMKLPLRHPVLVAKQLSSIAALAEGRRISFGVGLSPWREDYEAVNVPWERRGKRLDEMIEIIRGLCAGGYHSFQGEIFRVPSLKLCPTAEQRVPILVGGHSEPALRRAARIGDGWIHAGGDGKALEKMIARLQELRSESGRAHEPFELHCFSADGYTPDGVKRLEDLGVTDLLIGFRNSYTTEQDTQTLEEKLATLRGFAENVIARV